MKKAGLFLVIYLLTVNISFAQAPTDTFNFLTDIFTTNEGLSSTKITSITQDTKGFMWIGTEDGLNKFDGYNFSVYRRDDNNPYSLINDHITSLFTDSGGKLWVGTFGGLQYYDVMNNGFVSVSLEQPDYVVRTNQCHIIYEDQSGNIWFSSSGLGVLRYTPATGESKLFSPNHTNPSYSLCSDHIRAILQDREGRIWFGSQDKGISIYDPETDIFRNYNQSNSNLSSNAIFGMNISKEGNILIATIGGGISIYDRNTQKFTPYQQQFNTMATRSAFCVMEDMNGNILSGSEGCGLIMFHPDKQKIERHPVFKEHRQNIGDSKVHCIYEDNKGNLWVGMHYKGLCVIKKENNGFRMYRRISNSSNSLSYPHVMSVTTDKDGNVWIATDGGGLNCYNKKTNTYTHYKYNEAKSGSISDNAVVSVFCDSKNRIWAGTYTGGLCLLNRETGTFTTFRAGNDEKSLLSNFIKSIAEDKDGYLWLGTNGGGLTRMHPEERTFRTYTAAQHVGLPYDYIVVVFVDSRNHIWIGTYNGLSRFDPVTGRFSQYHTQQGLSHFAIYSITEDESGTIWVGTQHGLNKYNEARNEFESVYTQINDRSLVINGIVPFEDHLWLSTNNGIICFYPSDKTIKQYGQQYGLQRNEFILTSYHKSVENEIYFGGVNGLNVFHPEDIITTDHTPTTYITELSIFNQPVLINEKVNGRVILKQNISETSKIGLRHSDKSFTIRFTAPDAMKPNTLVYACRMAGFDNEWVEYDHTRRIATYTNLNPGTYEFQVKATNNIGKWGTDYTSLTIEITPPIWATWWAYLLYICVFCLGFYFVIRFLLVRIKERNELKIEKLKSRQQEELAQVKTDFYTNISHEFRTPLTLIIGPLEHWAAKETEPEKKQGIELMLRNARKLLQLINQLLELNKIEEGKMQLHIREIELFPFIFHLAESFKEYAFQKDVRLSCVNKTPGLKVWYDIDLLEKCVSNIISNAFKFTSSGGSINIVVEEREEDGMICLSISDTGIGMDEKTAQHIFDRFYQHNKKQPGTGIGMHLAKNIVELHNGTISVSSKQNEGSTFSIEMIPGKDHFNPDVVIESGIQDHPLTENNIIQATIDTLQAYVPEEDSVFTKDNGRYTILVIEDDPDMLRYIRNTLKDEYRILEAGNGRVGLEKAKKNLPDLIITDVMMPEMDGLDLTRIVKSDPETSHIPVIILTSQTDLEQRMEGLETGADSYISKPFNPRHLLIRIQKLIELRQTMKERFSKSLKMEAQEVAMSGTDERLLQRAIDYVRANMENTELNVETMSKELGLSRTHLHRKLKALTGQSPVEFIKMIRMKQAAYLLSMGKMSISEVGYKVGYSTPSYFSSSFNTHFGMSPTTYIEQEVNKKNQTNQSSTS